MKTPTNTDRYQTSTAEFRFKSGLPSQLRQLEAEGAVLCKRALTDMQALMVEIGRLDDISETGCLSIYADENEFEADRERLEMLDRYGFDYEVVGSNRLRDLEPDIAPVIQKAALLPDNRTVCGATLLVNMRDIEPRKEDDGFDGAFLSP